MLPALVWLLTLEGLGLAVLPLTARVFAGFPDRGFGLSRVVGLVVVGWLAYLSAMLGFTAYVGGTVAALAGVLAVGVWGAWGRQCLAELRPRIWLLALAELVFLVVFGLGTFVRAYNADIVGQEKFMDYAFMHALLRTTSLPAEDMWLSGFAMPYYYLGYLLVGLPAKIVGTPGPLAYNLAVVLVFAAGFGAAFSIVSALVAAGRDAARLPGAAFGLLGGVLTLVVGNLVGPLELVAARGWGSPDFWRAVGVKGLNPVESPGLLPAEGGWWWRSSRVIANIQPDGITEFPYFSFLLGDLHPHYVAIPFTLLIVALAANHWLGHGFLDDLPSILLAGAALATLIPASTWDVPTFWGLYTLAAVVAAWRREPDREKLVRRLPTLLAPFGVAVLLTVPYFVGYESQPLGLGIVRERTPPISLLILFGPALLIGVVFAGWLAARGGAAGADPGRASPPGAEPTSPSDRPTSAHGVEPTSPPGQLTSPPDPLSREERESGHTGPTAGVAVPEAQPGASPSEGAVAAAGSAVAGRLLIVFGLLVIGLAAVGEPTLALIVGVLLALLLVSWPLVTRPGVVAGSTGAVALFCWLVLVWAACVLFGVELIFLRDVFGTRMNTVFKFQYQAWLLFGVAGATALGLIWRDRAAGPAWRAGVLGVAALVLLPGLVYPLGATWTKSNGFRGVPTLMGDRFLERSAPADHRAIEWLRTTAVGRPVVVEAVGGDYSEHARVSTFSGLPTLIGWVGHELQWRGARPELEMRQQAVDAVYRATNREELRRLAENYRIKYVFFGTLERAKYGAETQSRLDRLLPVAYSRGGTTIYTMPLESE